MYLRSFADGNGDGTGDIAGLRSTLDYLQSLGVDAIWVYPWYRSPMNDGGYDGSDYRQIDPLFGSIDEVRDLWVEQQGDVIAYRRGGIVCQVNFGPKPVTPISGRVIISSGDATRELPPDTAIWVLASGADTMSD